MIDWPVRNATTAIRDLVTNIEPTAHTGKMRRSSSLRGQAAGCCPPSPDHDAEQYAHGRMRASAFQGMTFTDPNYIGD